MENEAHELVREFLTAVVEDSPKAAVLLAHDPGLLNARWIHDETVLHFLAIEGFDDGVRFLLARGADVNTVNEFGDSPLVDVVSLDRIEIAKMLLTAGADPNGPSSPYRDCPLDKAARRGNVGLVEVLLDAGADPRYLNHLGETLFDALDEAAPEDRDRIRALLAERGVAPLQPGDPEDA